MSNLTDAQHLWMRCDHCKERIPGGCAPSWRICYRCFMVWREDLERRTGRSYNGRVPPEYVRLAQYDAVMEEIETVREFYRYREKLKIQYGLSR